MSNRNAGSLPTPPGDDSQEISDRIADVPSCRLNRDVVRGRLDALQTFLFPTEASGLCDKRIRNQRSCRIIIVHKEPSRLFKVNSLCKLRYAKRVTLFTSHIEVDKKLVDSPGPEMMSVLLFKRGFLLGSEEVI